ncbi:hypothetical protein B9D04_03915 [Weissella cibaria]|uniref:Uncharacterized protein n=1 Tax=Weissella cibaria TaxID=137591 RepID=A0A1X4JLM9_9LACO|nr:hypothetical protein [Weissella cibaria]OSP89677.1 hypothetical protein B9D04_03915 [Weissella cibaria]
MLIDSLNVDVPRHTELCHVGDYMYLAVDREFDNILASFDTRSDLSKWALAQQDSKGVTAKLFWLCRMTSVEFKQVNDEIRATNASLRELISVRETSY